MATTKKRLSCLNIGRLAPAMLVLIATAEIVLRFVPLRHFSYRAWEAMADNHVPGAPFCANQVYHSDRSYGDIASYYNLPQLRRYRSETFTTDAYGYRNQTAPTAGKAPEAILIGSSFSVGLGVNDDETLAAQLSRQTGCEIYNAGGLSFGPEHHPDNIRALARRLHMTQGTVLYEVLNSTDPFEDEGFIEFLQREYPSVINYHPPNRLERFYERTRTTLARPFERWNTSRLIILTRQAYKRLENNRFFPNLAVLNHPPMLQLVNGDHIMLRPKSPPLTLPARDITWSGPYFSWLAQELRRDNLSLLVFLVPEKNTIYEPLLANHGSVDPQLAGYLAGVEQQLLADGIPVVNLTPALRHHAEAALAGRRLIYFFDDSHWNADGISVAAREMARHYSCKTAH